jgi:hypothetical protein
MQGIGAAWLYILSSSSREPCRPGTAYERRAASQRLDESMVCEPGFVSARRSAAGHRDSLSAGVSSKMKPKRPVSRSLTGGGSSMPR